MNILMRTRLPKVPTASAGDENRRGFPQGLKPMFALLPITARLKSCPATIRRVVWFLGKL
jgi:hypothetical protein